MPFVRQPPNGRIVSLAFGGVQKEVVKGFHLSLETYVVIVSLSGLDWRFDLKPYFLRSVRWESTAALLKSWIPNPNESNLGRMKKSHGKAGIRFWSLALNGHPCKKTPGSTGDLGFSKGGPKNVPKLSSPSCTLQPAQAGYRVAPDIPRHGRGIQGRACNGIFGAKNRHNHVSPKKPFWA